MYLSNLHRTPEVTDGDGRTTVDAQRRVSGGEGILEEHRDATVGQQQEVGYSDGLCGCATGCRTCGEPTTEHRAVGHLQLQVADLLAAVLDVAVLVDHHDVVLHGSTLASHRQLVCLRVGDIIHLGLVVILSQCGVDGRRDHRANLRGGRVVGQCSIQRSGDGSVGLRLGVIIRQVDFGRANFLP